MKKGEIYSGIITEVDFPNKSIVSVEGEDTKVVVKGGIEGQTIKFRCTKKRSDKCEGIILEVEKKADNEILPSCKHFNCCGGCSYLNLEYEDQLKLKEKQLVKLLKPVINRYNDDLFDGIFEGIKKSPVTRGYRNKMEYSFGDASKGGELELGLHKKGSFYDIVTVRECNIADEDYSKILYETLIYFRGIGSTYFHKINHEGFLRNLLVRKTARTGEILVDLVTSSQMPSDAPCTEVSVIEDWKNILLGLKLKGKIVGILHTINDSLSDAVHNDRTDILYGQDFITEELLNLQFKISPFSFFQTNTYSAEVLYNTVREFISSELKDKTVFDLYSGTGTIAQLIAPVAKQVVGVEIVEEAVEAARDNAILNGLDNCKFICDDVLKALDDIVEKPDFIILDPPRDGVHPKALRKIIDYGVDNIIYISCKPTSLARDLETFMVLGYKPVRVCGVDQFPGTNHVESVCLLSKVNTRD